MHLYLLVLGLSLWGSELSCLCSPLTPRAQSATPTASATAPATTVPGPPELAPIYPPPPPPSPITYVVSLVVILLAILVIIAFFQFLRLRKRRMRRQLEGAGQVTPPENGDMEKTDPAVTIRDVTSTPGRDEKATSRASVAIAELSAHQIAPATTTTPPALVRPANPTPARALAGTTQSEVLTPPSIIESPTHSIWRLSCGGRSTPRDASLESDGIAGSSSSASPRLIPWEDHPLPSPSSRPRSKPRHRQGADENALRDASVYNPPSPLLSPHQHEWALTHSRDAPLLLTPGMPQLGPVTRPRFASFGSSGFGSPVLSDDTGLTPLGSTPVSACPSPLPALSADYTGAHFDALTLNVGKAFSVSASGFGPTSTVSMEQDLGRSDIWLTDNHWLHAEGHGTDFLEVEADSDGEYEMARTSFTLDSLTQGNVIAGLVV